MYVCVSTLDGAKSARYAAARSVVVPVIGTHRDAVVGAPLGTSASFLGHQEIDDFNHVGRAVQMPAKGQYAIRAAGRIVCVGRVIFTIGAISEVGRDDISEYPRRVVEQHPQTALIESLI